MAHKLFFSLSLTLLLATTAMGLSQCRFKRIAVVQPSERIESEGGLTELWDEQFQCAGVVAMRNTIRPNGLSLPNYHNTPRLVFIEKGQGFIGITFPGCPETYHAYKKGSVRDSHQKVHRIREGDIVAIPAGAAHWCYNDGEEELVAVSINDVNHISNQLDQKFRAFYLAGGVPTEASAEHQTFQNIFLAFDKDLMAEAFNISLEVVERVQSRQEKRGLIVLAHERMSFITPEEEENNNNNNNNNNGIEERMCSVNIRTSIENRKEADFYSREAGKINVVDSNKLPILKHLDLSADRGKLYPNAMAGPLWANGHEVVFVTRGEGRMEVVSDAGEAVMKEVVRKGDVFVVPQYFASNTWAGDEGLEWVSFVTKGMPVVNTLAGSASVITAMPIQVLMNAYGISREQAEGLKRNRSGESLLLSPRRRQS